MKAIKTDFFDFVFSDDALFHYTKAPVAVNHIMPTMQLKLSQFKDTNDPWEYKFRLLNLMGWSLAPEVAELSRQAHPLVDRALRYECRVACLCSNRRPLLILKDGKQVEDPYALPEG